MYRVITSIFLSFVSLVLFGQIIADHRAVKDFDNIPDYYIEEVKKMMTWFAGESHSEAYRTGMSLVEDLDAKYSSSSSWHFPDPSDEYVRVVAGPDYAYGEDVWFTWKAYDDGSEPASSEVLKGYIESNSQDGNPIHVMGFAWCWDMVRGDPSDADDPDHNVHWYGSSIGGPDGNEPWGLDSDDQSLSGNRVSMDTYLEAIEDYIAFCAENEYETKMVYTTGPVDSYTGEEGYQGYIKHEYIRDHVKSNSTRILFDYADILCHDNDGAQATEQWNEHTYPTISTVNGSPEETGHISNEGALRLGKAMWWMLARIAGWKDTTGSEDHEASLIPNIINADGGIRIDNFSPETRLIQVIGIDGRIIQELVPAPGSSSIRIEMYHTIPTLYLIRLQTETNVNSSLIVFP